MADRLDQEVEQIPVRISYDIIRLFSEGLYKSPHKAVEELVSNSYDADASNVRIVLPRRNAEDANSSDSTDGLWVVDDGAGMDVAGFRDLWRVADSKKSRITSGAARRLPIGQFGIGKLAAYVLAWKLTHISRVESRYLLTRMDFRKIASVKQNSNSDPVNISLQEVSKSTAMALLAEIESRDPTAWQLLFGDETHANSWTATGLSEFKDLYERLKPGQLRWVLSTGLPLQSEFKVWINGKLVQSSKERLPRVHEIQLGSAEDFAAINLGFTVHKNSSTWVDVLGVGRVNGRAEVFQKSLEGTKSESLGRSHGFFIRVRGRVINLEDELFGLRIQNHSTWSRFILEIDADGLHDHLLSSREGVKDFYGLDQLRKYLQGLFNLCRSAFESWLRKENEKLDIMQLISDKPSVLITEPLMDTLRQTVKMRSDSFYMKNPCGEMGGECEKWLASNEEKIRRTPIRDTKFNKEGFHAPALRYFPTSQALSLNPDHPFVDKLTESGRYKDPAKLFGSSELLLEGQLHGRGLSADMINNLLQDRDRILRLVAGNTPPTAIEVLRQLKEAQKHPLALERVVGTVFQTLGFEYQRNGGHASGPDGILYARLGKHKKSLAAYSLVYDAKQTDQNSVSADKIDFAGLESFRSDEDADYAFFIAHSYAGELDSDSRLIEKFNTTDYTKITLLKIEHLDRLVRLHYRYGVTLTELRKIFAQSRTVIDVDDALITLRDRLEKHEIPLKTLLDGLEEAKSDRLAVPNYNVVRAKNDSLMAFEPERLGASLKGVESILEKRWIEVDENSGQVIMHQSSDEIIKALKDKMTDLDLLALPT